MNEKQYKKRLYKLLSDNKVNLANRLLFKKFFEQQEYKLKRTNNLSKLDNGCYQTLGGYVTRFRAVNRWFNNKEWSKLTKADIKRVYDGLEDGKIKTISKKPYKDRETYYNKIFKSKPFDMAGKSDLAREVIQFAKPNGDREVRFIEEETFRKLIDVTIQPKQKCLLWLSWDIGENINALLKLKKKDFNREINAETKETEYYINLPKEILKRSRKPRTEITNFPETVKFLDLTLKDLKNEDLVFNFGYGQAVKFLKRAVELTNAKCKPKGQAVTWKDLRNSMACNLLKKGWTTDEVNARLGHKPSSAEIDRYINFLAIDRHKPKKKVYDNNLSKMKEEFNQIKQQMKLQNARIERLQEIIMDNKIKKLGKS